MLRHKINFLAPYIIVTVFFVCLFHSIQEN